LNPIRSRLLDGVLDLVRELSPATVDGITAKLEAAYSQVDWTGIARLGATAAAKERVGKLAELFAATPDVDVRALALAIQATANTARTLSTEERLQIAWTGPATEIVPLRRVDQVLYELVESAQSEVILVTYAAYKAERALAALRVASERGVRILLIVELSQEAGGKLTFDGLDRIRAQVPQARVLHWPLSRRPRSGAGQYGAMHVKCLIADRKKALVSSANLTDYALEMNMELGLLVHGSLPGRLAEHFDQLIVRGELASLE
jgi:phosphatidylserine/phosphatidylglycerophosphate/cardiolipin synthase-like enzyme